MNFKTLLFAMVAMFSITMIGCTEDPCDENPDGLECETGDFDGDGIANADDTAPSDPCVPNFPSFEDNLIGSWTYSVFGSPGEVKFNEDGTYEEPVGEIVSNGEIESRNWTFVDGTLTFDVGNAQFFLSMVAYDCEEITFDLGGISEIIFTRK